MNDLRADDAEHPGEKADDQAVDVSSAQPALPEDAIIILPSATVLFPGLVLPLSVTGDPAIAAAQEAARGERPVGVLMQLPPAADAEPEGEADDPGAAELCSVGTIANVLRYLTAPDGSHHLVVQGEDRFRVLERVEGFAYPVARVARLGEPEDDETEVQARFLHLKQQAMEAIRLLPGAPDELGATVQNVPSAGALADFIAGFLDIKPAEKQDVLETLPLKDRLDKVIRMLSHRVEMLKISKDIGQQTQAEMAGRQREYFLREQLKAIQKELGEGDDAGVELDEIEESIGTIGMPEEVEKHARKELGRLRRTAEAASEYSMLRGYLELLIELPWASVSEAAIDIAQAREVLDEDHFGLSKIKRRILEHLAVRKLNPEGRSPILCFVGPPGVGKTSLGQSIARATGREFARVSLGGTHDEAEIRGHRRTYVGAMPGNIIQALKKSGTRDCVMMLDEIDKLGAGGFHGDPASALLEVLDPSQNSTFRDNYLGVPFDLSRILFICTANVLDTIPRPLLDRMEVIQLSSYTATEKLEISRRYLIKRQREQAGLSEAQCQIDDDALTAIIRGYAREAGVRSLERQIGSVFRHAAMQVAEGSAESVRVSAADLKAILGPVKFENEVAQRTSVPGVCTGLAWTPVGGDILFIEANRTPGSGRLILTGQLGDVMKESAQAALTLVKSQADDDDEVLAKSDVHIHVPAGAIPKDGPSAGVAMYVALRSMLSGRTVDNRTAMTGEISLRGQVLPVGGIREKVVAAAQAGITRVLLPERNRRDFDDIPEEVREAMEFVWVERIEQAVDIALSAAGEPAK